MRLLNDWSEKIIEGLTAVRDANTSGADPLQSSDVVAKLKQIQHFGAEGRSTFVGDPPSELATATKNAGDAWMEWAYTLLNDPPKGDLQKARRIADLAQAAMTSLRQTYELAGAQPPPELFRS